MRSDGKRQKRARDRFLRPIKGAREHPRREECNSRPRRKYQRADPRRANRSSGGSRFRAASAARKNPLSLSLVAIRNDSDRNAHAPAVDVAAAAMLSILSQSDRIRFTRARPRRRYKTLLPRCT